MVVVFEVAYSQLSITVVGFAAEINVLVDLRVVARLHCNILLVFAIIVFGYERRHKLSLARHRFTLFVSQQKKFPYSW